MSARRDAAASDVNWEREPPKPAPSCAHGGNRLATIDVHSDDPDIRADRPEVATVSAALILVPTPEDDGSEEPYVGQPCKPEGVDPCCQAAELVGLARTNRRPAA
jgi:hypothetical protein